MISCSIFILVIPIYGKGIEAMEKRDLFLILAITLGFYGCSNDDASVDNLACVCSDGSSIDDCDCLLDEPSANTNKCEEVTVDLDDIEQATSYILYTPVKSTSTYLISEMEVVEYTWESDYFPALGSYLTSQGDLVRSGHDSDGMTIAWGEDLDEYYGGILQSSYIDENTGNTVIDWAFNFVDDLGGNYSEQLPHHDFSIMPNCNILLLVAEVKSVQEAENMGRESSYMEDLTYVLSEQILELKRTENDDETDSWEVVWQWNVWDHLIQDQNNALTNTYTDNINDEFTKIDINYNDSISEDVFHLNDIVYIDEYDQIIVSSHAYSEIWVIDHSITTEQAKGEEGDLLYRWGNAAAYGYANEDYVFLDGVHDAHLYADSTAANGFGYFLMYDNNHNGDNSRIVEMTPDIDSGNYYSTHVIDPDSDNYYNVFGPDNVDFVADIYSNDLGVDILDHSLGSVQKLPSGGYLTCDCDTDGTAIWLNEDGAVIELLDLASASVDENASRTFRVQQFWSTQAAFMNIKK